MSPSAKATERMIWLAEIFRLNFTQKSKKHSIELPHRCLTGGLYRLGLTVGTGITAKAECAPPK